MVIKSKSKNIVKTKKGKSKRQNVNKSRKNIMRGGVPVAQLGKVPVNPTFVATEFSPNQSREFQQAAAKLSTSLAQSTSDAQSKAAYAEYAGTPNKLAMMSVKPKPSKPFPNPKH